MNHCREERQHEFVMAGEDETATRSEGGTHDHVHVRPIMLYHIEIRCGKSPGVMPEIAHDGERLEKHLGQNDRRASYNFV